MLRQISRAAITALAAASLLSVAAPGIAASPVTLKLAHDQLPDQGYGPGVAKFVDLLKEKVGDEVEIQVFDNGVLGNERDVTEGLTIGTQEMSITTFGVLTNYEPRLAVMNLPFMFQDWNRVNTVLESGVMDETFARLEKERGMKALAVYALGFRNIGSNAGPITDVESFKGLKIRVPQAPLFVDTFKALGANPTPIPWGELYTAMQTKIVDAFENSSPVVEQFKLNEVTKYLSRTGHIWEGGVLLISAAKFDSLSPSIQQAMLSAARESAVYQRGLIEKQVSEVEAHLEAVGMKVNSLDTAALQQRVAPIYDKFSAENDAADLVEKVKSAE